MVILLKDLLYAACAAGIQDKGSVLKLQGAVVVHGLDAGQGLDAQALLTQTLAAGLEAFFEKGDFPQSKAYSFPCQIELAANLDDMIRMDVKTFRPILSIVDTESIWGRLLALKYGQICL